MMHKTEYPLNLTINNRQIEKIVIDQHYKEKHPDITDDLITKLVQQLDGGIFPIEEEKDGFEYFVVEPVVHEDKSYRLVLLLYIYDNFLGVVNAFRVRR